MKLNIKLNIYSYLISLILSFGFSSLLFAQEYPNAISPEDAYLKIKHESSVLIDVREKNEVALGMAEPAIWYPKSSIDADLETFEKELSNFAGKEIILYCHSGRRASLIIQKLAEHGFFAWNMGGYQGWLEKGFPIKIP